MEKLDLTFKIINKTSTEAQYTGGCSGGRSDCCTRTCTRINDDGQNSALDAWEKYLEVNEGVLQY